MLGAAAVSTAAGILTAEDLGPDALHIRLLAAATLGIPLFTAVTIAGERLESSARRNLAALAGLLVLAALYADWPSWTEKVQVLRYVQLSVALHLMVSFLPFARREEPIGFWQYNRVLFVRFIAAGISSGVLFGGLALALAALDKLFGVNVPEAGYGRLWLVMAFVFNTWFFLGGLPRDFRALEERRDYPAALRVFAQYTLVPLVSMYLVILTLYFGKVVVTWDWPSGWIGYLVSGVATTGILALLLVHPVAEQPEQKWIATFTRDFWLGVLPAVLMLWLALYQRVQQYGITEPRYFLLVLSLWLAALAAYYSVTRSRNIRIIPISLCVLSLVTFAGPWGALGVSQRSQVGRLERLLVKDGVLVHGRVQRAHADVPPEDLREISATVRYLVVTHGGGRLAPWLGDSTARRLGIGPHGWHGGEPQAESVVAALGVRYISRWDNASPSGGRVNFSSSNLHGAIPLAGFDYLIPIRGARDTPESGDTALSAWVARESRSIRVMRRGQVLIDVPLDTLMRHAMTSVGRRRYVALPPRSLVAEAQNARARVRVHLQGLSVLDRSPSPPALTNASGDVLVRLR